MINGNIEHSRYPRIYLDIVSDSKKESRKFLIDTGFDDEIALSYNDADVFDLEILDYIEISYASGESAKELIATGLLNNCVMNMDFVHNKLTIKNFYLKTYE